MIWGLIEKLNLNQVIERDAAKQLFVELDVNKDGKIPKPKFVDFILKNSNADKSYKTFIDSINEHLYSKTEKIILKLKKLREKEYIQSDSSALDDINWYYIFNHLG